jgi:RNA polymerase sigma-70 factor (ECF subfamily)
MLFGKPLQELEDSELILHYKNSHDTTLLGELYQRYASLVYGVSLKYLKDREEAKDATMQVFEKLLSVLLSHEVNHFKSWLYITTKNHCLMIIRSRKNRQTEPISETFMETGGEMHLYEGDELEMDLLKLEKCIQQLNGEQKQCVQLFFLSEKSYHEISENTGYHLNKVKSYIQNGKRNLKICMESNG